MPGEFGIEKLKDALLFTIELGEGIAERLEDDGKLSWSEILTLIPKLWPLVGIIRDGNEMVLEFKDLDDQEQAELTQYVESELDIPNEKLEKAIENGWNILVSLLRFIIDWTEE